MIIDGRECADKIAQNLKRNCSTLKKKPVLHIHWIGNNPASEIYIKQKQNKAAECGIDTKLIRLSDKASFNDIKKSLSESNNHSNCDAIILQLPVDTQQPILPRELDELIETINPKKDADGLCTLNQGRLFAGTSKADMWTSPIPATALGIYRLLKHYKIPIKEQDISVVGKSRLVGHPIATLLSHQGATVHLCHSLTKNLSKKTSQSDIVIVAAGAAGLITPKHIHKNSVVIDVGIHKINGKLQGDLSQEAAKMVKAYSPVPGGVGPMTVIGLLENVYKIAKKNES